MKLKLSLCFLFFGIVATFAQVPETSENPVSAATVQQKLQNKMFDMRNHNRPVAIQNIFETDAVFPTQVARVNEDVAPFAEIDIPFWGMITDINTKEEIFFSSEHSGNQFTIRTYDNDIQETLSFSFEVPESANQVAVLNHHSVNFFSDDSLEEFLVYLHYFDPEIPGPEGQISAVWVVNSEGDILKELDAITADAKIDANGKKRVITWNEEDYETVTIVSYDVEDWSAVNDYVFDWDLINFFAGNPFDFVTIDGEEFAYVAHYKHELLDMATFEVYPDNNLVVKLLDFDLQEIKTVMLDIDTRYPDAGALVVPMAEFGVFYKDNRYDITKTLFDADDNLEFVYGIQYYDMMMDVEWRTFFVGNEEGVVLHELNETIYDVFTDMVEIEGFDNQLAFLMGEDGMETSIAYFDIESWEIVATFDAMMGDDQLSAYFNRIPREDTYHYLIGLGEPDSIDGSDFGVINEYQIDGTLVNRHLFSLPEGYELFQPILTSYALIPNLFVEDDELYFFNLVKQRVEGGQGLVNNLMVVKEGDELLYEFRGDTERGNIESSTFLTDGNGVFDKMTITYETSNVGMITEFYRLPLVESLSTDTFVEASVFKMYPNPAVDVLHLQASDNLQSVQIYDINGKLLVSQDLKSNQEHLNVSALASGIYLVNVKLENGSTQQMKLIKK